ncbi:hypothetical protein [Shewanella putrefaciens]
MNSVSNKRSEYISSFFNRFTVKFSSSQITNYMPKTEVQSRPS